MKGLNQNLSETTLSTNILIEHSLLNGYSKEAIWCWDLKAKRLVLSSNTEVLLGYSAEDLGDAYEWWTSNIHKDQKKLVEQRIEEFITSGADDAKTNEYRFLCKDGSYKFIQDHCYLKKDSEGNTQQLMVLMRDVTELKRTQKKLEEQEQFYTRQVDLAVMDAQQNERRKLAEELHDNVNQLLGVVKLYIEHSITNENIRDGLLKKSNQYIDKVIEELRNLSKNLAPPLLAELGLEHSLSSLAESIADVQKMNIWVEMDDFEEEGLTDNHKLMIYRIVQEQLNNIIKHANAENATIFIKRENNKLYLSISDDGAGTELNSEFNTGLGLRNIKNRIELFHGQMEIVTSPDNGFKLSIEFEM